MPNTNTESRWLPRVRLAETLGVTTMTIHRWERNPKLNFPKPSVINSRKFWQRDEILAWMAVMATGKAERATSVHQEQPKN
jgi:predicted DNA-binding transcriptional regulator AlpA